MAGDHKALLDGAIRVADVTDRHRQLLMGAQSPHGIAAEEQAIAEGIRAGYVLGDDGDSARRNAARAEGLRLGGLGGFGGGDCRSSVGCGVRFIATPPIDRTSRGSPVYPAVGTRSRP